jgi:hypothetical protein
VDGEGQRDEIGKGQRDNIGRKYFKECAAQPVWLGVALVFYRQRFPNSYNSRKVNRTTDEKSSLATSIDL